MKTLKYPGYQIHETEPSFYAKRGCRVSWIEVRVDGSPDSDPVFRKAYATTSGDWVGWALSGKKTNYNRMAAWGELRKAIKAKDEEKAE